jgi:flagellar motility protein MotE (MotC chaperone)
MRPRIRLIPATIVTAILLLGVKVVDVIRGTEALSEALLISKVEAEAPKEAESAKPEDHAAEKPAAGAEKTEEKADEHGEKKKDEAKAEGKDEEKKKEKTNANVSDTAGATADRSFSKVEVELLQNLAARRDELDRWDRNIEIKESALNATEKRINDKIVQIEAMKKEVSELLAAYNQQEDAKIRSLVKIYENMKPKEAANIFNELDMTILLLVIDKMSEKKAAPILAEMEPKRARTVTVDLATQRRINNSKFNQAVAPAQQ